MSDVRDERPLEQIQFAIDELDAEKRVRICQTLRTLLRIHAGVEVAQDIVDLGCTGLVSMLSQHSKDETGTVAFEGLIPEARYIRSHMAGSICGLPCYVPPDRFCLVHNGIGALQLIGNVDGPQSNPHPAGIALCSRELTDEERKQVSGMDALIGEHLKKDAVGLGLEVDDDETTDVENDVPAQIANSVRLSFRFRCPEHNAAEPEWRCRFCLAATVIAGDFEPTRVVMIDDGKSEKYVQGDKLNEILEGDDFVEIGLYVRAVRWSRKLVREG